MSTPESKLETAAANVTAEIAKVKAWYETKAPYLAALGGLVAGGFIEHLLKL